MRCPAFRSLGATLLLSAHLLACTEWHVVQMSPQALLDAKHPTRVRVTLRDSTGAGPSQPSNPAYSPLGQNAGRSSDGAGAKIVLSHPSIIGDSLVGERAGASSAVAVADVSSVAIHRTSPGKNLVLLGVIVGFIAAGAAFGEAMSFGN